MYKSLPHHKSGGVFFCAFFVVKLHKRDSEFLCKVLKSQRIFSAPFKKSVFVA